MKKTILHCLIFTVCFGAFVSCSKEVKTPSSQTNTQAVYKTGSPTTNTNTGTQNENNHNCNHSGCGGSSCGSSSGSSYGG